MKHKIGENTSSNTVLNFEYEHDVASCVTCKNGTITKPMDVSPIINKKLFTDDVNSDDSFKSVHPTRTTPSSGRRFTFRRKNSDSVPSSVKNETPVSVSQFETNSKAILQGRNALCSTLFSKSEETLKITSQLVDSDKRLFSSINSSIPSLNQTTVSRNSSSSCRFDTNAVKGDPCCIPNDPSKVSIMFL